MGALSIWHLVILLVVVVVIFGTGKLRNAGSDLGKAVKGFKDGMKDSEDTSVNRTVPPQQVPDKSTIDVETREKTRH